ncbi:hybrid sensor histidine kinase/response regulator [Sulfitobacter alexandrii]|uniref:histidine kinase n=1 Tax=Sulfitobacter alexandrii TaxID=1917485 RepID=A0A1J0WGR0_9RHOB|nr:PAS-domain containing protein [Sulfitobacter alexandrii]APE43503.1 hybrid sensor histidine kinase/response regulator [Sulfitobacter alexandrii]
MSVINPADSLERQNEKLLQITRALMRKVEQKNEQSGAAYAQFERAALLEVQVRERTIDLERTLDLLQESNARLEVANRETAIARENLTEAIETISEGFALFDPGDRLVLFNSRFCRDLSDIVPQLREGLTFDAYVSLVSGSRVLSLPPGQSPEGWARQRTGRHRDDHVVFNVSLIHDRWLQVSEHRTARGGTVILQTDVTNIIRLERQERQKVRDEQAQILRATLDHLDQGVCIFDRDRKLIGWNRRMDRLLDLPPRDAALGRSFVVLLELLNRQLTFHDSFDSRMLIDWAMQEGGRQPIAFEVTGTDQQVLSIFAQEMPDRGFVISFTDVSAERAAARALSEMNEMLERRVQSRTHELGIALSEAERANASKSRFVAAASHDLLQPLSAAKLFISALSDQVAGPDQRGIVEKAETALSSVEQIIEALLDISRLDAHRPTFDIQPVALAAVLGPLRDELTPVAEAKGIDLRFVDCGLSVRSDPGYLRRIVQNLVSNAVRYTQTGRVLVGVRRRGGVAQLQVWDTGPGIAETDQEAIFQEFRRLSVHRAEHSLGLGLAIVERACKSLGHRLGLSSSVGRGSLFRVDLPIVEGGQAPQTQEQDHADAANLTRRGDVVFLVENDDTLANALTLMMESWGAEVIHAVNGEEAMKLLDDIDLRPDALVVDYQLGEGMSGLDLIEQIRARYGDIPARLISANRGLDLERACRELNVTVLPKPIDKKGLFAFLNGPHRAD